MTIVGQPIEPQITQRTWTVPPGENVNQSLQFYPLYAIVSNYSPYWLFLPYGGNYVPPSTVGAIVSLFHAIAANLEWTSPYGPENILPNPAGIEYKATVIFTNDWRLSPAGGSIIQDPNAVTTQFAAATSTVQVSVGGTHTYMIGVTNRAIRLVFYEVVLGAFPAFLPPRVDSAVSYELHSTTSLFSFGGRVTPNQPSVALYPNIDIPTGDNLIFTFSTDWANSAVYTNIAYQVI
jgi:hypothetical protein